MKKFLTHFIQVAQQKNVFQKNGKLNYNHELENKKFDAKTTLTMFIFKRFFI